MIYEDLDRRIAAKMRFMGGPVRRVPVSRVEYDRVRDDVRDRATAMRYPMPDPVKYNGVELVVCDER